jgi:hypothetical protein
LMATRTVMKNSFAVSQTDYRTLVCQHRPTLRADLHL